MTGGEENKVKVMIRKLLKVKQDYFWQEFLFVRLFVFIKEAQGL